MGLLGTTIGAAGLFSLASEVAGSFSPTSGLAQVSPAPGVQVGTIEQLGSLLDPAIRQIAPAIPGGTILTAGLDIVSSILPAITGATGTGVVKTTGFSGGNGRFKTRTTVETMDTMTGKIVRSKTMPGSPHLMNSEVSAAKRVFRRTRKLNARLPRRTVKESKMKQLTDAAVDATIRNVQCDDPSK